MIRTNRFRRVDADQPHANVRGKQQGIAVDDALDGVGAFVKRLAGRRWRRTNQKIATSDN